MQKFVQNNFGKKAQQNRPGRKTRRIEEDNIKRDLRKVWQCVQERSDERYGPEIRKYNIETFGSL